jgi:hypothetical protein
VSYRHALRVRGAVLLDQATLNKINSFIWSIADDVLR